MNGATKPKSRRFLHAILVAVYSIVIAFVLLEAVLRIADPVGIGYYAEARQYFDNAMVPNDHYAYIHRAGFRGELQGVDVSINSQGLRSPEVPIEKPAGRKRVLFLGDSVVFGWGAHQDSIFPALVRRRLKREAPDWDVISAGVGSWNTRTEFEWLRTRGLEYDPDIVVLVIVSNDINPKTNGRTHVDLELLTKERERGRPRSGMAQLRHKTLRAATRASYSFATLSHVFRRRTESPLARMYQPDSPAWEDACNALEGIVALCRGRGVELVVYMWGDRSTALSRTFLDAYASVLDDHDQAHHTFPARLFDPRYRNSPVDSHANAAGHAIMADALLETLRPILEAR